jgi:hypothetical protein
MRPGVPALATFWLLLVPAIARAEHDSTIMRRSIDQDGWPVLAAKYGSSYAMPATASWRVCNPDCGPVVATGFLFEPGPTAIGTTFEATGTTVHGTPGTERSPAWGGQVTNTALPTFEGEPRVGQTLTPRAGAWTGGWGAEFGLVGMRACPSAAAQDCRAMTASILQPGNPAQITIDPAYTGWYVGAIESRYGAGTAFPAIGYPFTPPGQVSQLRAPLLRQTIVAGPLRGPVLGAPTSAPPTARLSFTPRATIRRRAARRGRALVLATVRCSGRCVAHAKLRHGSKTTTRRIVVTGAQAAVKLWPGTFSRHATKVRVSVRFDNHPATASGTVKLR